jgi:DNA (cytosine-5)-methyltransferase 1
MSGLKVLDLFSGIGGFSLGLERTGGFETVAFCEIDKKARLVLKKHWPDTPIFEDVTTLTGDQINDKIDIIVGGFPCQDISLAGKGAGLAGARSGLWYEYHRLIKEIRPSWVIAENVSALRSRGLDEVLRSLAEIGYDAEWHCIPAAAVGAPHQRDRIWVIAYANADRIYRWPQSQFANNCVRETIYDEFGGICPKISDALRKGLERQWQIARRTGEKHQDVSDARWWAIEPDVGRVAHGVSGRVDRLKQLGNAVVPQIPELIGRAILASISKPSR